MRLARAVLACLLAGCAVERLVTVDGPITTVSGATFGSGTIDLHSRSFAGLDTVPRVMAGAIPLHVERLDTFLVRVTLPDSSGVLDLTVVFADDRVRPIGTLTVAGFGRWYPGGHIMGNPVRLPGTTQLLANGDSGVVLLDARTGLTVSPLPVASHDPSCTVTPGVTTVPGTMIATRHVVGGYPGQCRAYVYSLGAQPAVVDSGPPGFAWTAAYFGTGRWIWNTKNQTWGANGSMVQFQIDHVDQPEEYVASPTGGRLFATLGYDNAGVPVYDAATLAIAYRLPLRHVNGVAFSAAGDTAFLVGIDQQPSDTLRALAIDPQSGQVLRRGADLPNGFPKSMVAEADRPWLYLTDVLPDGPGFPTRAAVWVIDRRTMRRVALLRAPDGTPAAEWQQLLLPLLDPVERKLYLVSSLSWITPGVAGRIFQFDLLP